MTDNIKLLQLNIRGILSKETQQFKCQHLNSLIETKQIDVVLLQEWSAIKRCQLKDLEVFPTKYFPNYSVHFHSTETAMYTTKAFVSPLYLPNQTTSSKVTDKTSTFVAFSSTPKLLTTQYILYTGPKTRTRIKYSTINSTLIT